jgi:lactoylglutathione lyase
MSGAPRVVAIHHVAVWVSDLERARAFYVDRLGGRSGPRYRNPRTGFRSYFVSFGEGAARIELMSRGDVAGAERGSPSLGYAHVALSVGSREGVDAMVRALAASGTVIDSGPRQTGDGYYEAVVLDPEGNRIEITE